MLASQRINRQACFLHAHTVVAVGNWNDCGSSINFNGHLCIKKSDKDSKANSDCHDYRMFSLPLPRARVRRGAQPPPPRSRATSRTRPCPSAACAPPWRPGWPSAGDRRRGGGAGAAGARSRKRWRWRRPLILMSFSFGHLLYVHLKKYLLLPAYGTGLGEGGGCRCRHDHEKREGVKFGEIHVGCSIERR